jgi:hypothetical protein
VFHDRSKHIDTRYHYIRECVERNCIIIKHISMEKQLGDMLTKALGRVRFQELRSLSASSTSTHSRLRGENCWGFNLLIESCTYIKSSLLISVSTLFQEHVFVIYRRTRSAS